MSRHISSANLQINAEWKSLEKKKLLLLKNGSSVYGFLMEDNRICRVVCDKANDFPIGTIVLARVDHVQENLSGCFMQLDGGKREDTSAFLPLSKGKKIRVRNRENDDRILQGDEFPVMVTKDAENRKQLSVSSRFEIAGKYSVFSCGTGLKNVSKKLKKEEKEKLLEDLTSWINELPDKEKKALQHIDIKIRTNAGTCRIEDLREELNDLLSRYKSIDLNSQTRTVFSKLYEPPAGYIQLLRDLPEGSIEEIVTDIPEVFQALKKTSYADSVATRLYEDKDYPLMKLYSIQTKVKELLSTKVYMKNGGYLFIEATQACVVVDVNSGKCREHPLSVNKEALKEVLYQIGVRSLSGMILIDFIDFSSEDDLKEFIRFVKKEVRKESIPTTFMDYTALGFVELTRKKGEESLRATLREWDFEV